MTSHLCPSDSSLHTGTAEKSYYAGEVVACDGPLLIAPARTSDPQYLGLGSDAIVAKLLIMKAFAEAPAEDRQWISQAAPCSPAPGSGLAPDCKAAAELCERHFAWAAELGSSTLHRVVQHFIMYSYPIGGDKHALARHGPLVAHSCAPNTIYCCRSHEGDGGYLIALTDIGAGEALTADRVGPAKHMSTVHRLRQLRDKGLPPCQCWRCRGRDLGRQLPCPHCHERTASGKLPPEVASEKAMAVHYVTQHRTTEAWHCQTCQRRFNDGQLGIHPELEQMVEDKVMGFGGQANDAAESSFVELCACLQFTLSVVGSRHWTVTQLLLHKCQWLVKALYCRSKPPTDACGAFEYASALQRQAQELLDTAKMLWWCLDRAQVSTVTFFRTFVEAAVVLQAVGAKGLEPLLDYCCWLHPSVACMYGAQGVETQAVTLVLEAGGLRPFPHLRQRGDACFASKDFGSAIHYFSQAILADPSEGVLLKRSEAYQQCNLLTQALRDAERCAAQRRGSAAAHHRVAVLRELMGNTREAQAAIERALQLQEGPADWLELLARVVNANVVLDITERYADAEAAVQAGAEGPGLDAECVVKAASRAHLTAGVAAITAVGAAVVVEDGLSEGMGCADTLEAVGEILAEIWGAAAAEMEAKEWEASGGLRAQEP